MERSNSTYQVRYNLKDTALLFSGDSNDSDQNPKKNPRFMPNKKPPKPTNQLFFLLLMVFLVILIFLAYKAPSFSSVQAVDFSTFWSMVQDGKVREVVIEDTGNVQFKTSTGFQDTLYETYVPWVMNNPNILDKLIEQGVKIKSRKSSGDFIWALLLNILPLLIFVFIFFGMMRSMSGRNNQAFSFTKSPARLVSVGKKRVTFKDVAGVDEAVEDLQELVVFLKNPQKYDKMKARMPKGVLLVGPPGTGKTLLARAVAGEANVPFFHMSGSDFVELFVGVGAARVRDLFNQAKSASPSVIFIDEIDAVGRHRGAGLGGGHDEREQTLNQILVEMDGFDVNEGVIIMAATNRPDILDPALLRPGRFDRKVVVDPPDVKGRESILSIYLKKRPLEQQVEVSVLARRTPGFVGADLENLCNEAALLAVRGGKEQIGMPELEEAIDRVLAGPERKSRIISQKEKKIIAYHELGHALVSSALKNADPVHRVSIIPRGHQSLGHTLQLPLEDKYLMSKSEIFDKISAILGGRAAEEIVFEEITSGASNDIERATELARTMVCQLGMSSTLGPISWGKEEQEVFLGRDFSRMKNFSDETAKIIDQEVRQIIDKCYNRAKEMIRKYKNLLDRLAEILLEKEVIDGEFLREMLNSEIAKENHIQPKMNQEPNLISEMG
jgi:cell division protease FtsH